MSAITRKRGAAALKEADDAVMRNHPTPWNCLYSVHPNIETSSRTFTAPSAEFYADWWKNPNRLDEAILKVTQPEMWDELNLVQSNGHIIVREEYKDLYESLSKLPDRITGALVTGQDGIGKSYFGAYVVLRRIAQGQTVLFTTSYRETYMIDNEGIWRIKEKDFTCDLISCRDRGRIWSILMAGPPSNAKPASTPRILDILISPLIDAGSSHWSRQHAVQKVIVNPWTIDEIKTLFFYPGIAPVSPKSGMDVEMLVAMTGPCPRDIFESFDNPGIFWQSIQDGIRSIGSLSAINELLHSQGNATKSARPLIVVRRAQTESNQADSLTVDFKTRGLGQAVFRRVLGRILESEARVDSSLTVEEVGVSRELAGGIFEQLAHKCISDATSSTIKAEFDVLIPMRATRGQRHHFKCVRKSEGLTGVVEIDWDRKTIFKLIADEDEGSFEAPSLEQHRTLPLTSRKTCLYDSLETIALEDNKYYIPTLSSNSLFDSFFLEKNQSSINLWVMQILVARNHGWSLNGIPILKSIINKAKEELGVLNVEVKYVLVVPRLRGLTATWKWPCDANQWEDVAGDVYLQPLGISLVPFSVLCT